MVKCLSFEITFNISSENMLLHPWLGLPGLGLDKNLLFSGGVESSNLTDGKRWLWLGTHSEGAVSEQQDNKAVLCWDSVQRREVLRVCRNCTLDNDSLTWDLVYRGLNTESCISILKINCWNVSVKHVKLACVVTSSDAVLNFPIRDHLVWISFFLIFSSTHLITVCFCFFFL